LLPTTRAGDQEKAARTSDGFRKEWERKGSGSDLPTHVAMLPTPKVQNANSPGVHGRGGKDLQTTLAILGTPTTRDWKDTGDMTNVPENGLMGRQVGKRTGLRLQPAFALWMMGYRADWCDLEAGEMPPSKRRATASSPK